MNSARHYGFALIIAFVVAVASGHGTAWADSTGNDPQGGSAKTSESATDSGTTVKDAPSAGPHTGEEPDAENSTTDPQADGPSAAEDLGTAEEPDTENRTITGTLDNSPTEPTDPTLDDGAQDPAEPEADAEPAPEVDPATSPLQEEPVAVDVIATPSTPTNDSTHAAPTEAQTSPELATVPLTGATSSPPAAVEPTSTITDVSPAAATPFAALASASPAAATSATVGTTVIEPMPLSPIARILALPGQIVNAVLQVLGFTTAAGTPPSPVSPAPLADLFFAIFRRIESALGLDAPVTGLPAPPSLVYTGPLTTPTPTVAQFLNAATTSYVLGGAPGGLTPFVVDGFQLESTDIFTGMSAKVWMTPQNQVIIAYSGTTGGTNLLFNPLIAISQVLTDLEGFYSNTTPRAFIQAVEFAQRVQLEAAKQGYASDGIFVTGHSLGGWEAGYVAQQLGLGGIGFESPGLSSTVPGNGANALFVNTASYGDLAAYFATDLPGLHPFAPAYVPGGGTKPHYGPIVLLGDPNHNTPMINAARLFGTSIVGTLIAVVDLLGNFFANHLPGVQAYNLDVRQDPGVVPWLGINNGPVHSGFGELTIPEFLKAASDAGILVAP